MVSNALTGVELKSKVFKFGLLSSFAFFCTIFISAGSFLFWQAWLLFLCIMGSVTSVVLYFLKNDQKLLERRMSFHEKEYQQQFIVKISMLFFCVGLIVAGLDYRLSLSKVPLVIVLLSDFMIVLGYRIIFLVFKANSFAARTIEVMEGQKVITSGPYSIVRHPMYVGVIVIFLFFPLALASFWSILFFLPVIPLVVWRIINEEFVLCRDLYGYENYVKNVKYRLVPYLW